MIEPTFIYSTADRFQQANDDALLSAEAAGFPGCVPLRLTAEELERFERHIEYWDDQSGIAWMTPFTLPVHEIPAVRLVELTHRIAQFRGSDIAWAGKASLYDRGPAGGVRVMEADQIVYLDAARCYALHSTVEVQRGEGPDIVLEVDITTDARRRKVGLYKQWQIPEIWVEVPDTPANNCPESRRSGLTIYALNERTKRYGQVAASKMLPGWTAIEIHTAFNEPHISKATWMALHRVGRAMGEAEGTPPADDPLQRALLLESNEEGWKEGLAEGRAIAVAENWRSLA